MTFSWPALAALLLLCANPASAQTSGAEREELVVTTAEGARVFQVELADEPRERQQGLMFRRDMEDEHGMLFDFGEVRPVSMWMANTYVPLDMIFINADGTVESIAERTTPLSTESVASQGPVRYVLEINAGLSDELGIRPGDTVSAPSLEAAP